ncbi:MAG: cytochrome c [Gemmatimonadetes bacterium]|nr:cytochrome c [Gemmatimonadota bacterium]
MIPRWFYPLGLIALCLALVPFAVVAKLRATKSSEPRPQIIWDMDQGYAYQSQQPNALFNDGRAMRPAVNGTVARGQLREDDHMYRGKVNGEFATTYPDGIEVNRALLERGKERYEVFCLPCHGYTGAGDGIVSQRADKLQQGTWIPPVSYHSDELRSRSAGHIYNTISNGIRSMPAYGLQVKVEDRWAIVAYIRALQRSQNATIDDVPANLRDKLR